MSVFDADTARMPAEWEPHEAVWLRWSTANTHDAAYAIKLESTLLAMAAAMASKMLVRMVADRQPEP